VRAAPGVATPPQRSGSLVYRRRRRAEPSDGSQASPPGRLRMRCVLLRSRVGAPNQMIHEMCGQVPAGEQRPNRSACGRRGGGARGWAQCRWAAQRAAAAADGRGGGRHGRRRAACAALRGPPPPPPPMTCVKLVGSTGGFPMLSVSLVVDSYAGVLSPGIACVLLAWRAVEAVASFMAAPF
jgi:hypothetical protein